MMFFSKIVLIAVQDEGASHVRSALNDLRRIGGFSIHFGFRGSYALIGYKGPGRKPFWVKQKQHRRKRGPSVLSRWVRLQKKRVPCK